MNCPPWQKITSGFQSSTQDVILPPVEWEDVPVQTPDTEVHQQVQDTVSSMRLDAVVSTAFSMARGKAAELIAAGRVSLNHIPCEKPDKTVGEADIISARGFGKAVVRECSRVSKKGRIILIMDRYI